MRRQMTAGELEDFYRRIGAAIWRLQYLEDILVNFLTLKLVHERRCAGGTVAMAEAQAQLAEKRKLTLGPLIESCVSKKIISRERVQRFEAFKAERHWLVHRSMIENGDDLYLAPREIPSLPVSPPFKKRRARSATFCSRIFKHGLRSTAFPWTG